jgi:hypothetical protein
MSSSEKESVKRFFQIGEWYLAWLGISNDDHDIACSVPKVLVEVERMFIKVVEVK